MVGPPSPPAVTGTDLPWLARIVRHPPSSLRHLGWLASRRAASLLLPAALLERFLGIEAASGVVLLLAAAAALVWANSPRTASYERFRQTRARRDEASMASLRAQEGEMDWSAPVTQGEVARAQKTR